MPPRPRKPSVTPNGRGARRASMLTAQRNRPAPKILESGEVGARSKAYHVPIHSFNRILFKRVDGKFRIRFRLDLLSKNVG